MTLEQLRAEMQLIQPQVLWSDTELKEMFANQLSQSASVEAAFEDEQLEEIAQGVEARLRLVAEDFAALLRQRIPVNKHGKSKGTAQKVRVIQKSRFHFIVNVPFPWQFNEFVTINHPKANPIVRRTLAENSKRYERIIAGQE